MARPERPKLKTERKGVKFFGGELPSPSTSARWFGECCKLLTEV